MAGLGLVVTADLGAEEHQAWLLRPLGRSLDVFAGERILDRREAVGVLPSLIAGER